MFLFKNKVLSILMLFTIPAACLPCPVLVIGDSISAAYGLETTQGWVRLLQQKLKREKIDCEIINSSISGDTTGGGAARINQDLATYHPQVVIIELGGNDGLRGLPPRVIKKNLKTMIDRAQSSNSQVILLGIEIPPNYGKRYTDSFKAIYQELATETKIDLVPELMTGIGDQSRYMQEDGIHPNRTGQSLILEKIWPRLHRIMAEKIPD